MNKIPQTNSLSASDVITFIRRNPEAVVEALLCEHRTHQQATAKSIYQILKEYGKFDTDLRNEAAVSWAKKVTEEQAYFPFL
jgi:hypothetical protein